MKSTDTDILIIGGGITGLMCAASLQSQGRECVLLEAGDRLGGRIRTEIHQDFLLDVGFQVYLTSYENGLPFLMNSELGLGSFKPGAVFLDGDQIQCMGDPFRDPSSLSSTLQCRSATLSDKWKIYKLSQRLKRTSDEILWNMPEFTTDQYLLNQGFSESIIEKFFRPFFGGVFLDDQLSVSSRLFEYLFKRFAMGLACLPAGGMQAIPQALSRHIASDSIKLNTKAESLENDSVVTAGGDQYSARKIVVALDEPAACDLLNLPKNCESLSTHVYYYSTRRKDVSNPSIFLNSSGAGPIQHLCFPSYVQRSYAPEGYHLVSVTLKPSELGRHYELSPKSVKHEAQKLLQLNYTDWEFLKSFRVPKALPMMKSIPGPGFRKWSENVWQAGDYLSFPSTNGALLSGKMVANELASE